MGDYKICKYGKCTVYFKDNGVKKYCSSSCRTRSNEARRGRVKKPKKYLKSGPLEIMGHFEGGFEDKDSPLGLHCCSLDFLTGPGDNNTCPKCGSRLHVSPIGGDMFEVWCEQCGTAWRDQ
jgi:hypothetical protein